MAILFAMYYNNLTISISIGKIAGHLFGTVDGTVLAAGASESDLQAGEISLHIFLNTLSYEGLRMVEELVDGGVTLQELDDGTVFAGIGFVFGIAAGVGKCTAVEDESAAVAAVVVGQAFAV